MAELKIIAPQGYRDRVERMCRRLAQLYDAVGHAVVLRESHDIPWWRPVPEPRNYLSTEHVEVSGGSVRVVRRAAYWPWELRREGYIRLGLKRFEKGRLAFAECESYVDELDMLDTIERALDEAFRRVSTITAATTT